MVFCGEYHVQPDVGIKVSRLKSWINDINGEGYISGSVLHNYLFGVKPKPSRLNRIPPTVTSHPPDVMVKPVTTVSTVSPPPAPRMVFPPVPPGLQQPSSSSSSATPIPPPPTLAPFPLPPLSLRTDPYPMVENADNNPSDPSTDHENEQ